LLSIVKQEDDSPQGAEGTENSQRVLELPHQSSFLAMPRRKEMGEVVIMGISFHLA